MYRLILVDDEPWSLTGLSEIIPWEEYGFEICGLCRNGAEALSFFEQQDADAVFTDIRMPGMGGLELIAAIKQIKAGAECVVVSAYSDFEAARKAIEHRASGYILKPLEESEVREAAARAKARLDSGLRERLLVCPGDSESLADAESRLARMIRHNWRCVVLSPGKIHPAPTVPECMEIQLKGVPLNAAVLAGNKRVSLSAQDAAFSRWHEGGVLKEMLSEASAAGCGGFTYADHPAVSKIQYYIGIHYRDTFSLEDLALHFSISKTYLGELFKKHTGDTVVNFTRTVRLENARRLITYNDLPFKEIADECGFSDPSYFGRNFRQLFGITPAQYHARCAGGLECCRPDFWLPGFG
jgi:two-component system response regulator YesN